MRLSGSGAFFGRRSILCSIRSSIAFLGIASGRGVSVMLIDRLKKMSGIKPDDSWRDGPLTEREIVEHLAGHNNSPHTHTRVAMDQIAKYERWKIAEGNRRSGQEHLDRLQNEAEEAANRKKWLEDRLPVAHIDRTLLRGDTLFAVVSCDSKESGRFYCEYSHGFGWTRFGSDSLSWTLRLRAHIRNWKVRIHWETDRGEDVYGTPVDVVAGEDVAPKEEAERKAREEEQRRRREEAERQERERNERNRRDRERQEQDRERQEREVHRKQRQIAAEIEESQRRYRSAQKNLDRAQPRVVIERIRGRNVDVRIEDPVNTIVERWSLLYREKGNTHWIVFGPPLEAVPGTKIFQGQWGLDYELVVEAGSKYGRRRSAIVNLSIPILRDQCFAAFDTYTGRTTKDGRPYSRTLSKQIGWYVPSRLRDTFWREWKNDQGR